LKPTDSEQCTVYISGVDKLSASALSTGRPSRLGSVLKGFAVAILVSLASVFVPVAPSHASGGNSIALYFSAPFVTGSHVVEGALTETFNGYSGGATSGVFPCPSSIPGATLTFSPGSCTIEATAGSSSGSSVPAIGVPISSFINKTTGTTFTFENPVKYVGFWWMMGSNGNNVEFLDNNGTPVADFNVNDVVTFLGANNLVTNDDLRTVTTVDGGTHLRKHFYRSPATYTGTVEAPVMDYSVAPWANEPWIYLNLFVTGDVEVGAVRFSGPNFEMDNLTVATTEQTALGDMVLVQRIGVQELSWSPSNTTVGPDSSPLTPSSLAVVTSPLSGGGAISYSVVNAGPTGCTVNSATGVITYTQFGQCVVRATAAAVPGLYYSASKDVTFTFSETVTVDSGSGSGSTATGPPQTALVLAATGPTLSFWDVMTPAVLLMFGFALLLFAAPARRKPAS